jgi:DNA-binding CsgD family transcriptional regulator/pimeloyl-ACP methyl ester carboxylesterase
MKPQVRYVTTGDGVRIAFSLFGATGGRVPLVVMRPPQWSHVEREWAMPRSQHEFDAFIGERPVIRFDPRGTGLSQRRVEDQSIEGRVRDLQSVVERLQLDRFALDAVSSAALVAMRYTASNPQKVARLVIQNAFLNGEEWWAEPARRSLLAMAQVDWPSAADAWAWLTFGSTDVEQVRQVAAHIQDCLDGPDFLRMAAAERETDVSHLASTIECPTLVVVHPRFARMAPSEPSYDLAGRVPSARLVTVTSTRERIEAIRAFLKEEDMPGGEAPPLGDLPGEWRLTGRERDVLVLLIEGMSNREIAQSLTVSPRTVDGHVANLYQKVGVHNRAALVAAALRARSHR